ncbi:MAG: hypothetical protein ACLP1D_03945 [Xanthobacteraceae bacterium]
MVTDEILSEGIARGIISADQAAALRALSVVREGAEPEASPDDERLRFVSGFSDIFVTLGLAMFIGALGYFVDRGIGAAATWASVAATAWLLAEFFTRARRMALPSIALLVAFAASVFMAASLLLGAGAQTGYGIQPLGISTDQPLPLAIAALLTVVLTAAHYWRFRVPITVAAGCAAMTIAVVGLAQSVAPICADCAGQTNAVALFVCGIAIFAAAMRFDMADPRRLTRRADIAFWLHLLAAPLIVHSFLRDVLASGGRLDPSSALVVIAIFVILSVIALLIDRRALLVSGMTYAGYAFAALLRQAGLSDLTVPTTVLALGAFVLMLSAGWRPLRGMLLRVTPLALTRRLPQASLQS